MNPARRTPVTLSAALLLGVAFGLARPWEVRLSNDAATVSSEGSVASVMDASSPESRAGEESFSVRSSASTTSDAYGAAWELLKGGNLPRKERRAVESGLWEEWAKVDLRAALRAAFEGDGTIDDDPFESSPADECMEEIQRQGDLVWDLISSREYGLHTRELRTAWIRVFAEERPLEVLRRLKDLPPDVRTEAVRVVVAAAYRLEQHVPGKEVVVAAVLAFRGTVDEAAVMEGFAGGLALATETSELSALLLNPPDPTLREVYLMAYVIGIRVNHRGSPQAALEMLPADLRAEVEWRLDSPVLGLDGGMLLTEPLPPPPEE